MTPSWTRSSCLIELSHFEQALSKVKPSVSEQVRAMSYLCIYLHQDDMLLRDNRYVHHCDIVTCFHPWLSFLFYSKKISRGIVEAVLIQTNGSPCIHLGGTTLGICMSSLVSKTVLALVYLYQLDLLKKLYDINIHKEV
jgi:hypothetical protein